MVETAIGAASRDVIYGEAREGDEHVEDDGRWKHRDLNAEMAFYAEARAAYESVRRDVDTLDMKHHDVSSELERVKSMLMEIMATQAHILAALAKSVTPPTVLHVEHSKENSEQNRNHERNPSLTRRRRRHDPDRTAPYVAPVTDDDDIDSRVNESRPISSATDDDDENDRNNVDDEEMSESQLRRVVLARMLAHQRRRVTDH